MDKEHKDDIIKVKHNIVVVSFDVIKYNKIFLKISIQHSRYYFVSLVISSMCSQRNNEKIIVTNSTRLHAPLVRIVANLRTDFRTKTFPPPLYNRH